MKHTPKPPNTQPYCTICKGIGWFEGFDYSEIMPKLEMYPCPRCNPVAPLGRTDKLVLGFFITLVISLAVVAWVLP